MSFEKYCTASVTNVEYVFETHGLRFLSKCVEPLSCSNHPKMDVTGDLNADGVQCYQELIVL